jgi:hypothetical protein
MAAVAVWRGVSDKVAADKIRIEFIEVYMRF